MASGIGIVLVLFGLLVMAIGYGLVSNCRVMFININCWDPFIRGTDGGAFGLYTGAVVALLGTIIVAGPSLARFLGKLR